jgi:heme exporter protein D
MDGPNAIFILLAYAAAVIVIGALIAWVTLEYRSLKRTLADFEQRGVTRRSDERAKTLS